jgi:uncharacterized protein (DUF779 family)
MTDTDSPSTPAGRAIRVTVTPRAASVLEAVEADVGEAVAVVLNDGCCDGMGPVAIRTAMLGHDDVKLGEDAGIPVYAPANRVEVREGWDVTVDVEERSGSGSFSLEVPRGYRLTSAETRAE